MVLALQSTMITNTVSLPGFVGHARDFVGNINGLLALTPPACGAAPPRHALQDGVEQDRGGARDTVLLTMLTPVYEPSKISLDSTPEIALGSTTQLIGRRKPSCLTVRCCEQVRWCEAIAAPQL
jgi:hypothetical protein